MLTTVWLTIVIAVLGAVALVVLVLVLRGDRAAAPIRPETGDGDPLPSDLYASDPAPSVRGGAGHSRPDGTGPGLSDPVPSGPETSRPEHSRPHRVHPRRPTFAGSSSSLSVDPRAVALVLGSFAPPRRPRSVEGNLQRAFARIDAVDPYAVPRRIGEALADAGLTDPGPLPPLPAPTWPPARAHTGPFDDSRGGGPDGAGRDGAGRDGAGREGGPE